MAELNTTGQAIKQLVLYGVRTGLIQQEDAIWAANRMADIMHYEPDSDFTIEEDGGESASRQEVKAPELEPILKALLDDAVSRGVIEDGIASRDLFDTKLMGILTPRPSDVIREFWKLYVEDPKKATDYFYRLSKNSDYIRTYRVRKDRKWVTKTQYGDLDITINLSKPEKDPKAIAAALNKKQNSYPKCLLCHENEGYAGRLDHPARENIRLIPLTLNHTKWYMQYSPYVYYNEHCIVLSEKHTPMRIDRNTFACLLNFISIFPHYTIGSNADLPIVGGSILTHEHFQGGNYTFAMARAGLRRQIRFKGYDDVQAGIVNWPLSVIRLDGRDPEKLVDLSDKILSAWRGYSDASCDILAETDGTPHNTITPIARRRADGYEMDLVLRNNRTTDEYPLGIFHPHQELHHIKKENIGLIEVMGLAVLPSRLLNEMEEVQAVILQGGEIADHPEIASHADWVHGIIQKYPDYEPGHVQSVTNKREQAEQLRHIIEEEIGLVFAKVLECCGVFKDTEEGNAGFMKFIETVNGE